MPSPTTTVPVGSDSVPPPGDLVKMVQDAATSAATTVVDKVSDVAGLPKKAPATGPARQPVAAPPLHLPSRPAIAPAAAHAAHASWSLFTGAGQADRWPELPSLAGPMARTPVVAGTAPAAATPAQIAAANAALAERGNSVMRGVLIALAAAAAATLATAHVAAVRGARR